MKMKWLFPALCLLLLAGCSNVVMMEPFPETPLTDQEKGAMEGTWRIGDDTFRLAFDRSGAAWLAQLDWEDDEFKIQLFRLCCARRGDVIYVSMPQEPGATNRYLFAEIKPQGDTALAWMPNSEFFQAQVEGGQLEGTVEGKPNHPEIRLAAPASAILDLLSTTPGAIDYKNPMVFERIR